MQQEFFKIAPALEEKAKQAEEMCREPFRRIEEICEYNQLKVIHAMQKNRVSERHFAGTTGYGYDDDGRDTLEKVYADIFHTRLRHCAESLLSLHL